MEKIVKRKVRILQRDDGVVFTHTKVLEANPRMRPGWKVVHEGDTPDEIVLDAATVQQLDPNTTSAREHALIEQNALLREQLAQMQGMLNNPLSVPTPEIPEQPGETPIPAPPPDIPDLTTPGEIKEESIPFRPEPEMYSESAMGRMKNDDLIVYAKDLNNDVEIPAEYTKESLVELCLAQQEVYKAKAAE